MIRLLKRSEAKLQVEISGSKENQIIYGEIQVKWIDNKIFDQILIFVRVQKQ